MVQLNRHSAGASLAAAAALVCNASSIHASTSPTHFTSTIGSPHNAANHVGFQHISSSRARESSWAQTSMPIRGSSHHMPKQSRHTASLNLQRDPNNLPMANTQSYKSSTALFVETKQPEVAVNGDPEAMELNGEKTNGSSNHGAANATEGELVDFFERIFQKESFGALTNGDNLANGEHGANGVTKKSDIQKSIESLTADAEENNVPDILNLTVEFANQVYNNMTENGMTTGDFDLSSNEFPEDLPTEITESITELFRQLEVSLDERFAEALEEMAFYDVQGLRSDRDVVPGPKRLLEEDYERMRREGAEERKRQKKERTEEIRQMKQAGLLDTSVTTSNATTTNTYMDDIALTSKRMRTSEIFRNFNVAPIFYTVALANRWIQKASVPPMAMLMFFRGLAYPVKWREGGNASSGRRAKARRRLFGSRDVAANSPPDGRTKMFGDEQIADEEFIQGWKRTGEIAAKGKRGRAIATFRRSAEIWFYFSSFYIKDAWILKSYNSGRWTKDRFEQERGKLGAQLTQNLLRLGPTFIKVCYCCDTEDSCDDHERHPSLLILSLSSSFIAWTNLLHPY